MGEPSPLGGDTSPVRKVIPVETSRFILKKHSSFSSETSCGTMDW